MQLYSFALRDLGCKSGLVSLMFLQLTAAPEQTDRPRLACILDAPSNPITKNLHDVRVAIDIISM